MKNIANLFLCVLGMLIFSPSAFASRAFENFHVIKTEVVSLHAECREGCPTLTSTASLNAVQIVETDGQAVIRGSVVGFKLIDERRAPFSQIDGPIELSLDVRGLQEAQRQTERAAAHPEDGPTPDFYNGVKSSFRGFIFADGKTESVLGQCYQHNDLGDLLTANRDFQCTVGDGLDKDILVFRFILKHKS